MKKIELLAPAGNLNSLKIAIQAGCDAVYIGGYAYSARTYADNFSNEEIIEAVNYAHIYGVKVYVAVNTLVYDYEVTTFLNYIDFLHKNNVDAIIIQDLGMFDLVRKTYPNLEIHASTQMHIHNIEGARFAKKYGMKRIVLSREVPIEVIRDIRKNVDIDIEVFCHGALCFSYSGQCLMSSLIGGRSGNRGACAGTCRLPFDLVDQNNNIINKDKYLLSMKDLNTIEYVGELIDSGITSLKIEGRMKREEYIYEVISIYRKAIDNYYKYGETKITDEDILDLRKIYNRKFTKGYLFNEENKNVINHFRPNHQGIKIGTVVRIQKGKIYIKLNNDINQFDGIRIINKNSDVGLNLNYIYKDNKLVNSAKINDIISIDLKDKVDIGDVVLKTTDFLQLKKINDLIKLDSRKVKIDGYLSAKVGEKVTLKLTDLESEVIVKSNSIVEEARNNPLSESDIEEKIRKIGNTPYVFNDLKINVEGNIFASLKELNELRREAIQKLTEKRLYKIPYKKENYQIDLPDFKSEDNVNYFIKSITQYERIKDKNISNIYVDDKTLYEKIKNDNRIIYKLPRVMNNFDDYQEKLLVGEVGSINKYIDSELTTDFSLNVTNSYTVAFLHAIGVKKITLSYEMEDNNIEELIKCYISRYKKRPNLELIIYGYEEMMISKFRLLSFYNIKNNNIYLKDRHHELYKVIEKDNLLYIYNSKPRNKIKNSEYYKKIGVNNLRINIIDDNELNNL